MAPTAPIRVAIIGLGRGTGDLVPGLWAAQAHLPYLVASPHFRVTAVCNSTVASAQASIDHYNLSSDVKAYGSPSDVGQDPNVDLAVVAVRVSKHYDIAKPLILAGKDIFVEWPLAATTAQAEELTVLAKEKGVRTLVGLQARASPLVSTLREIISSNQIGKVISSAATGYFIFPPTGIFFPGAEYYLDMESGGNSLTIYVGHVLDSFTKVLGPFSFSSDSGFATILETKFPTMKIIDTSTGAVVNPAYTRTSPDHILLQGKLESGALASFNYRTIPVGGVEDDTGFKWVITGMEGEMIITTAKNSWSLLKNNEFEVKIRKGAEGSVETVDVTKGYEEESQAVRGVLDKGRNTARLWEAWVNGDEGKTVTFEDALQTQKLFQRMRSSAGK